MLSGLAPHCTVFVMTTTRKLLQTRRKRVGDNNDEYARTTDFDWRSQLSTFNFYLHIKLRSTLRIT